MKYFISGELYDLDYLCILDGLVNTCCNIKYQRIIAKTESNKKKGGGIYIGKLKRVRCIPG